MRQTPRTCSPCFVTLLALDFVFLFGFILFGFILFGFILFCFILVERS